LADATPRVIAPVQAVYCHNLAPFYKITRKDAQFDPVLAIYHFIFKYIYQINIRKNKFVIVQQQWLKEEFEQLFEINNVLVAYPKITALTGDLKEEIKPNKNHFTFFYPSIPRVFKNFELITEAVKILLSENISNFEMVFTFSGTENKYAQSIYKEYGHIKQIKFVGELSRKQVFEFYKQSDAVIFSSKTETWGMGISEGMTFQKPIFAIDFPYARETAGNYNKIKFFNPNSPDSLANNLDKFIKNRLEYDKNEAIIPTYPFAKDWRELFDYLGMNS
jgi:glycosyltransferase involved in cell wall biosynthesis